MQDQTLKKYYIKLFVRIILQSIQIAHQFITHQWSARRACVQLVTQMMADLDAICLELGELLVCVVGARGA